MDKSNFKKLALMGMAGGLVLASSQPMITAEVDTTSPTVMAAASCGGQGKCNGPRNGYQGSSSCGGSKRPSQYYTADADQPQSQQSQWQTQPQQRRIMSENELMSQLSNEGKALYQSLSPEGKALALKLASQDCKNKNDCKGQNSCRTDKNECAGQGGCRNNTPGPFRNKLDAIKVAVRKMAEKRGAMQNQPTSSWNQQSQPTSNYQNQPQSQNQRPNPISNYNSSSNWSR